MKINVQHVAKLANIPLSDEEVKKFERQLSDILQYIEKLNEVDTENIEPTSQVTGLENVLRNDASSSSLQQKETISGTKNVHNGFFQVKGILDTD